MMSAVVIGIAALAFLGLIVHLQRRIQVLRGKVNDAAHAEAALQQRETLFRQLTESIDDVMWISSPDSGAVHYVSPGYERIWGRTVASLLARPEEWIDSIVPEDRHRVHAAFAALAGDAPAMSVDYRIERPDGTMRCIRDRGFQVRDAEGRLIRSAGIATDVTERQRIEGALQQRQAQMHALFDLIPAMIWFKDAENRILRVNKKAAEAAGLPVDAIEGRPSAEIYPSDAAKFHADDLNVIHSGAPLLGIVESMHDPGQPDRWVRTDKVPYRDGAGKVIGVLVLAQDISERKNSENLLRLLGAALEHVGESILITDAQLEEPGPRIVFTNPAFTRMTGYEADEVLGKTPRILQGPQTDERILQRLREDLQRDGVFHGEAVNYRKNGTPFDLEWHIAPIRDAGGVITHFVAVQRDVTERKAQELALRQAKDTAVAASASKSAFLATMSHEIRTPLNAVIGMTDLLMDSPLSEEQRSFAETIRTGGNALLGVINDILDFSRIESGSLEIEAVGFELRECVEDAIELVAHRAELKGLELGCLIDPTVPRMVAGDSTRVRQVLVNLLSNAVKFTERGEVRLEVSASASGGGCKLQFAVVDTGIGIAPDRLERLFRSFSQVDASTTRKYGGSGLGLAICKGLCERMGGEVWVESSPGKGSTFYATVTCALVASGDDLAYRSLATTLFLKRILVVDDNATSREIMQRKASSWGMVPTVMGSGREALACLRSGKEFDLALLDMAMPEMDGLTLAREIRTIAACDALPLVMLTSIGLSNESSIMAEGLFAARLTKPAKHLQLRDVLVRVITQGKRDSALPTPPIPNVPRRVPRSPLRILLADDSGVNRTVALSMLKRLGFAADSVGNGWEAVEAVAAHGYDVVLMDMQMPVMDGLEATRRIRLQRDRRLGPWIIAMTANAMRDDQQACLRAGMDEYLAKPVRLPELEAALNRAEAAAHRIDVGRPRTVGADHARESQIQDTSPNNS